MILIQKPSRLHLSLIHFVHLKMERATTQKLKKMNIHWESKNKYWYLQLVKLYVSTTNKFWLKKKRKLLIFHQISITEYLYQHLLSVWIMIILRLLCKNRNKSECWIYQMVIWKGEWCRVKILNIRLRLIRILYMYRVNSQKIKEYLERMNLLQTE